MWVSCCLSHCPSARPMTIGDQTTQRIWHELWTPYRCQVGPDVGFQLGPIPIRCELAQSATVLALYVCKLANMQFTATIVGCG